MISFSTMRIIAMAATSLDGFITKGDEAGTAFTSEADKAWFSKELKKFPVKVMGRKTFEASQAYPTGQTIDSSSQLRFVLTRSPESFRQLRVPGRLEFTDDSPKLLVQKIIRAGHQDSQIVILGGGSIYSGFLEAELVNEFWITLDPQLFGSGTPLLQQATNSYLKLLESTTLGPSTLLLKYRCERSGIIS